MDPIGGKDGELMGDGHNVVRTQITRAISTPAGSIQWVNFIVMGDQLMCRPVDANSGGVTAVYKARSAAHDTHKDYFADL